MNIDLFLKTVDANKVKNELLNGKFDDILFTLLEHSMTFRNKILNDKRCGIILSRGYSEQSALWAMRCTDSFTYLPLHRFEQYRTCFNEFENQKEHQLYHRGYPVIPTNNGWVHLMVLSRSHPLYREYKTTTINNYHLYDYNKLIDKYNITLEAPIGFSTVTNTIENPWLTFTKPWLINYKGMDYEY